MSSPLSWLGAMLLSSAAHTGGHFDEASDQGIDMRLNGTAEQWRQPDQRKNTQLHAAGFRAQDQLADASLGTDMESDIRYANSLYKAFYPVLIKKMTNGRSSGDIEGMERSSGIRYVTPAYAVSALMDYFQARNPDRRWSYSFDSIDGAPGGRFTMRF